MSSLFLCSVSILMLICTLTLAAQNFVNVTDCPKDTDEWEIRSKMKNCYGDTPDYLCASIENMLGRYGEICTIGRWIPEHECVVLNKQTRNLDSVDCKADTGCPSQTYLFSEVWRYNICFENFYGITKTLADKTTPAIIIVDARNGSLIEDGSEDSGSGTLVGVVVAVVIILIIVVVVMVVLYVRNQFGFKDKVQQMITDFRKYFEHGDENTADAENGEAQSTQVPLLEEEKPDFRAIHKKTKTKKEKVTNTSNTGGIKEEGQKDTNVEPPEKKIEELKELLKYLVHILKQELGVNDLKEKVVIHSKSVKEHFSEPVLKELQSLKDINDYSQLDMSLVFALLRNFCERIKPPSRGWDYEPPDDETHVGADIERIRFMWNKYVDNDSQFKHLDDVYKRMKQKYRTQGDDCIMKSSSKDKEKTECSELMKEKISSIKLNPDCTVEKGIVITENITTALQLLKSRNVVILKGVIGCGKTHALKAIQNDFQERNWKMAWVKSENFEGEISHEKPTIYLWDNLFGKFGASVFSQDAVNKTEKALKDIESSKQETKVVIGIHTHVYDEVKKNLKLNFLHQKNITVEMDKFSDAEALLIFKKQLKKGHCKMDPNCWFKNVGFQSVLNKLSKNQGHIGGPFLSLMYCNQHELFSDNAFSVNPVQTLMQHFKRMQHDSSILYDYLVYMMCVQQHNCKEEPEEWAGEISADIKKQNLTDIAKTSRLLHVGTKRAKLAHELLTIVLFKSAIEKREMVLPVLKNCDIDVFIQLLRPTDSTHGDLYLEFTYTDSSQPSNDAGKKCAYRLTQKYTKQEIVHPLMTVEFIKKKYLEYLYREPKYIKAPK